MEPAFLTGTLMLFGVALSWRSPSLKINQKIDQLLKKNITLYQEAFDPDCRWRPLNKSNLCSQPQDLSLLKNIEALSEKVSNETLSSFNIHTSWKGRKIRDFGGISQGFVLQQIKDSLPENSIWGGNFAGDLYFSGGSGQILHPVIPNPVNTDVAFAKVDIRNGWIMSSYGNFDEKIRIRNNPKIKNSGSFLSVTVFAKPEINGAQIDAWGTAIIAGGKKVLSNLERLHVYNKNWAYLVFNSDGSTRCSKNLQCLFKDVENRKVIVPW